jgi:hypothetical protein
VPELETLDLSDNDTLGGETLASSDGSADDESITGPGTKERADPRDTRAGQQAVDDQRRPRLQGARRSPRRGARSEEREAGGEGKEKEETTIFF